MHNKMAVTLHALSLMTPLKVSVASALARTRWPGKRSNRVVVLCYHSVHPSRRPTSATPALFEEHLALITETCEVIPFEVAINHSSHPRTKPAVAVTFDDGYLDNHEYAFPLLLKYGVTATFFLHVGLMEQVPDILRRAEAYEARRNASEALLNLTWSQVLEMQDAGMEFGSHTWAHLNLARESDATVRFEMSHSKAVMEERIGRPISTIAIPFGKPNRHFTSRTLELAAEAGYERGGIVLSRRVRPTDHPLAIPRFIVANDSIELLRAKLFGKLDVVGWWQEKAPHWMARRISPEDFSTDEPTSILSGGRTDATLS